jgi:hypothetical protein
MKGERIILKRILHRIVWYGLGSSGAGQGPTKGSSEASNEPSSSIKRWEIPEYLSNWGILKKDSAPWT